MLLGSDLAESYGVPESIGAPLHTQVAAINELSTIGSNKTKSPAPPPFIQVASPQQQSQQQQLGSQPLVFNPNLMQQPQQQQQQSQLKIQSGGQKAWQHQQPMQQQPSPYLYNYQLVQKQPSYVEQLWANKRDIIKYVVFSFVIVVGLSIHGIAKFVLNHVLEGQALSFSHELSIRVVYPLIVVFLIWNMKLALQTSR